MVPGREGTGSVTLGSSLRAGEGLAGGVPGARGWVGRWARPLTRHILRGDGV